MSFGLLLACGSNEPGHGGPHPDDPLGQAAQALLNDSISVTPGTLMFTGQPKGTQSTTQSVAVTNLLNGSAIASGTIGASEPFRLVTNFPTNPATFGKTVNLSLGNNGTPGDTKSIHVVFEPTAVGTVTGTLTVVAGSTTKPITLTGTAVSSASVNHPSLAFPAQKAGTSSQSQTLVVSNAGPQPFQITALDFTGPFVLDTPPTLPLTVAGSPVGGPVGTQSLSIKFSPLAAGATTGNLTITTDEPSTITVGLSGIRVPLATQITSAPLTPFGDQSVGTASASQQVTVRNAGDTSLELTAVAPQHFELEEPAGDAHRPGAGPQPEPERAVPSHDRGSQVREPQPQHQ